MNQETGQSNTSWRALIYFNLYRFLLAALFVSLIWIWKLPDPLGVVDRMLFSVTAHLYLTVAIFFGVLLWIRKTQYKLQIIIHTLTDIVMLTLMMFASGSLSSGFGMLLVIAVTGGGLLAADKFSFLFAAVATLSVLGQEFYSELILPAFHPNYIHAAFLGFTFFIVALLAYILARRIQESEALAKQRAFDIEGLSRLNERIVQRLQSGIIVLDDEQNVRLLNTSARRLLGLKADTGQTALRTLAPDLAEKLEQWLYKGGERNIVIKSVGSGIDLQVSFTSLQPETRFGLLIFLEDMARLRQRAQHMKLASLGRLAASIAHEVRNPLGAISHAGQLLTETETVTLEDNRLLQIILDQSQRVNTIIENVQKISRREDAIPQTIAMREWLEDFRLEFIKQYRIEKEDMVTVVDPDSTKIRMDASQLHQVLWNLAENAIRYSTSRPLVKIRCTINRETERPVIDITDTGPGIAKEARKHLFEPFFTSDSRGSGLGLYIARELCEANQASLDLYSSTSNGCCFRINLAHIKRELNLFD